MNRLCNGVKCLIVGGVSSFVFKVLLLVRLPEALKSMCNGASHTTDHDRMVFAIKRSKLQNEEIVIGVVAEVFQSKSHESDIITVAEMPQCCFIGACRVPTWHDHVLPKNRRAHDEGADKVGSITR